METILNFVWNGVLIVFGILCIVIIIAVIGSVIAGAIEGIKKSIDDEKS